ncbi:MAG: hypothetical protein RQ751_09570 [Longimicrobiales bacterium]|nr:hypothetical protein [Longimicrobiales bacterium]
MNLTIYRYDEPYDQSPDYPDVRDGINNITSTMGIISRDFGIPYQSCGLRVNGYGEVSIWNEFLPPLDYPSGTSTKSASDFAALPNCPTEEVDEPQDPTGGPSPGAGGGGGGCATCVDDPVEPSGPNYCRVKYWYDIATGDIIRSMTLFCY